MSFVLRDAETHVDVLHCRHLDEVLEPFFYSSIPDDDSVASSEGKTSVGGKVRQEKIVGIQVTRCVRNNTHRNCPSWWVVDSCQIGRDAKGR